MIDCKVRIHTSDKAGIMGVMPIKGHENDAGLDLASPESVWIDPNDSDIIDTLVSVEIPEGYAGIIIPRSSKNVIEAMSCTGLIDSEYNGTIKVRVYNDSPISMKIDKWERFCQLVIFEVPKVRLVLDHVMSNEKRGSDGYGSTDRRAPYSRA